jgi:hypothetical protein
MKKLLAILLALAVIGGAAIAQATVNGYVRTIGTFTDNGFAYADRLRLNLNYLSADKNVQFFGRIQGTAAGITKNYMDNSFLDTDTNLFDKTGVLDTLKVTDLGIKYLWGSVQLPNGYAKLTGGYLGNYDYSIGSGISEYNLGNIVNDDWHFDSVYGLLLQVFPIKGLNLGAAALTNSGTTNLNIYSLNGRYDVTDLGSVVVEGNTDNTFDWARYSATVSYTGVKDLTVNVGYKHHKNNDTSVIAIADYGMGEFAFEVAPEYFITQSALYVEGYVSYAKGPLTLNLLGAYDPDQMNLTGDYFAGLEVLYSVGKGLLQTGVNYDGTDWSIPVIVKVSF